jgi:hypothetical protein
MRSGAFRRRETADRVAAGLQTDARLVQCSDHRVLWSRDHGVGDTGDFDLATKTFTPRATGMLARITT